MMAPPTRKSTSAEIALISLKSCLINLPSNLVNILLNANTATQDVVVELTYKKPVPSSSNVSLVHKSVFVGWTGFTSRRVLAPIVSRDGIIGGKGGSREQEILYVEIDTSFAHTLGLGDGDKVGVLLHLNPPLVHTVNIEPLTPADWEIIELHANFLEINLLSQIRALPNPSFAPSGSPSQTPHPLTLHLSPTSTADIAVTSFSPPLPSSSAFAKISPDAEIIVAPKARARLAPSGDRDGGRSVVNTGRRSGSGRSGSSAARPRSQREQNPSRDALFLRGVNRQAAANWFDVEDSDSRDVGLKVWLDRDSVFSKGLRTAGGWAAVTVIRPSALQDPVNPQQAQQQAPKQDTNDQTIDSGRPALRVVARLRPWEDAPNDTHAVLSTALCSALGADSLVGGLVKIEAAPPPVAPSDVKALKVFPFSASARPLEGLRFGGESKAERLEVTQRLKNMFDRPEDGPEALLNGPITDGMILESQTTADNQWWDGGILKFDPSVPQVTDWNKVQVCWTLRSGRNYDFDIQAETPRIESYFKPLGPGQPLQSLCPTLAGIDPSIEQLTYHLLSTSSVLLTGARGSGKSAVAHLVGHRLRSQNLFHTAYFPCRNLITDETRVSTIKETLDRLFMTASWGARQGGRSLLILDDIDRICPTETELQVGGDNGRSRQISEILRSIARKYTGVDSGVVLLATAQGKEAVHNLIISCHVVREILNLKAPDKEGRRQILKLLMKDDVKSTSQKPPEEKNGSKIDHEAAWMDLSSVGSRPTSSARHDGFVLDRDADLLELAGQTDGYMPGDLVLLVARARSEAIIRDVDLAPNSTESSTIALGKIDFTNALKGFTPAGLRNVTLQSSSTTFASIGGLHATRKVLLETLQYPTTYAPIFAQCPLRLRSGLLLYGFPGCGKTLLASAVAGECGLNFISVKGPEILNKYIGASEKSVRDLFERAEAARPCVLFFDEFDSIAPKRGHDSTGVTDRVVNQLLTQMDGAEGLSGVYVLAATSRPDLIDPALLRPGRLDKSLLCDLPNKDDRLDIMRALSKKLKMSRGILDDGLPEIAKRTEGYSGADLQAVVYNAQLEAIHDVLGDQTESNGPGARKKPERQSATTSPRDFFQFTIGEALDATEANTSEREGHSRSQELASQAAIIAKLDALKLAKYRRRQQQLNASASQPTENGQTGKKEDQEVVIEWRHLLASLASTRSSISLQERKRLAAIYREFVVGRNGEMPDGMGSTEVGGRTTLM